MMGRGRDRNQEGDRKVNTLGLASAEEPLLHGALISIPQVYQRGAAEAIQQ